MTKERKAAVIIGVLYIVGDLAGFASVAFLSSLSAGSNILAEIAAHRTATVLGAVCILTMGFALAAIPAVFYSVGRRFSEALTNGFLVFRGAFEGVVCLLSALFVLVLVAQSAEPAGAALTAPLMATAHQVLVEQLGAIPFVIGAAMFYWLLFRSRLVPRWIALWGLAMAPLYISAAFVRMAGLDFDFLMFPLAIQEMVLAVWLIAKGFSPEALAQSAAPADGPRAASHNPQTLRPAPGV